MAEHDGTPEDDEPRDETEGDAAEDEEQDEDNDEAVLEPRTSDGEPGKKPGLFDSPWTYLLLLPIVAVVWLVLDQSRQNAAVEELAPDAETVAADPLTVDDEVELARVLDAAWRGEPVSDDELPARLREPGQAIYMAFRAGPRRVYQGWTFADLPGQPRVWDVLLEAIKVGKRELGGRAEDIDRLEINLTHSYRSYDFSDPAQRSLFIDKDPHKVPHHFGVRGFKVNNGERNKIIAPTYQVASNRKTEKYIRLLQEEWGMSDDEFATSTFETFEADQVLVRLDRSPAEAVVMFRGNQVVPMAAVDKSGTDALAQGMAKWLTNNVHPDGRMTYHYYPSTGREAKGNNMIRQWMATNALVRWAEDRDPSVYALAERNIDYNLSQFFHFEGELGVIEYSGKTKLGATALAGMAMWLHPKRDKWAAQITGLRKMVDHLWHPDGSFTSFYKGPDKEYWNFYPGEAMLWWSLLYAEERSPELLLKYKQSFAFYRGWHLDPKVRNPAFIPWHLQANFELWRALGEDEAAFKAELVEFSFEMADWLLEVQQWDEEGEVYYPDEKGRFYEPSKRFGVPHASSTGVYLEGLIDAWQLAKAVGDEARAERYRVSMLRGIRSMMQLQFVDDVDMYYVSDRSYVEGGVRTTVHDNRVRCDNVQHPLMGIIKILRLFAAEDYRAQD